MTSPFTLPSHISDPTQERPTAPHESAMISIGYWPICNSHAKVTAWQLPTGGAIITDEAAREAYRKAGVSHVALYWLVNGWRKSGKVWRKGNGYMNEETATSQFMRRNEPVPF